MNLEVFLQELKEFGIANDVPNISEKNAAFLKDLLRLLRPKKMLEIGSANGYSTIQFASVLQDFGGHLTSVEFSEDSYNQAINNIQKAELDSTINLIFGNALEVVPDLTDTFDFAFIDGMKRRTKDFLDIVYPKVKTWGVIIVDDVIKFAHKMTGLEEYLEKNKIEHHLLPIDTDDGIMMIVKK